MQRAHHFAGGIEVGGEVINPKQCQCAQQANLSGTVHKRIFRFLAR